MTRTLSAVIGKPRGLGRVTAEKGGQLLKLAL
jgi:hypothetical protein